MEAESRLRFYELAKLRRAIKWALGEGGEFPPRAPGEGSYWWRKQLRKKAGKALTRK